MEITTLENTQHEARYVPRTTAAIISVDVAHLNLHAKNATVSVNVNKWLKSVHR